MQLLLCLVQVCVVFVAVHVKWLMTTDVPFLGQLPVEE